MSSNVFQKVLVSSVSGYPVGLKYYNFLIVDEKSLEVAMNNYPEIERNKIIAHGFEGKDGQYTVNTAHFENGCLKEFMFGANTEKINDPIYQQELGAKIADFAAKLQTKDNTLLLSWCTNGSKEEQEIALSNLYFGFMQKIYRFDKYLTTEENRKNLPSIKEIKLHIPKEQDTKNLDKLIQEVNYKIDAIYLVRDLVNEPANTIYPESFVKIVSDRLSKYNNVKIKIIKKQELEALQFGGVLGVACGSERDPYVAIIEYIGKKDTNAIDLALIGKGVTFDSGGLSLKPANSMEDMKCDMAGAATVFGTLNLVANLSLDVNVIGVMGLVENMPSGHAMKPGDILNSYSGQTIEVLNTDAEGRLVLADLLYYAQKQYKPNYMIDLATLTGAIMVALGTVQSGLFSNSDEFAKLIFQSGNESGERCWRMPLGAEYSKMLKSEIADMKNISGTGHAGSITAAAFLEKFIDDNKNWAHLDVAGVDFNAKGTTFSNAGASGYGVKLLYNIIKNLIQGNNR